MIVIKVELHSAITHKVTELGRMVIHNIGGTLLRGNYGVKVGRKGQDSFQVLEKPQRSGKVESHPRLSQSVWCLVAKALASTGYAKQVFDDTLPAAEFARSAESFGAKDLVIALEDLNGSV